MGCLMWSGDIHATGPDGNAAVSRVSTYENSDKRLARGIDDWTTRLPSLGHHVENHMLGFHKYAVG